MRSLSAHFCPVPWRDREESQAQGGAVGQVLAGLSGRSMCQGWGGGMGAQGRRGHLCPTSPQVPGPGRGCWPPASLHGHQRQQPDKGASNSAVRAPGSRREAHWACPRRTSLWGRGQQGAAAFPDLSCLRRPCLPSSGAAWHTLPLPSLPSLPSPEPLAWGQQNGPRLTGPVHLMHCHLCWCSWSLQEAQAGSWALMAEHMQAEGDQVRPGAVATP